MKLNKIDLFHFRNLSHQTLNLNSNKNYFIGENAQGKTNLLEAVYFLSHGKSFRPTEINSFIQFSESDEKLVQGAQIQGSFQHRNLGYQVRAAIQNSTKNFTLNQKKVTSTNLKALIPMVLFSPESLDVIKESAEQRRGLVDELVLSHDPKQAKIITEFTRALKTRNALLKDIMKNGLSEDRVLTLESLNQIYLVLATHLTKLRLVALKSIWEDFEESTEFILGNSMAKLHFEYLISGESANNWDELKIFGFMQTRMAYLRQKEYGAGHTLVGPQKHDLKFFFNENDTRFYCSQGQQRALILALKIAQIVYHQRVHQKYPILLLDDVLSELDENKRLNLMKFLGEISAQVLITATDLSRHEIRNDEKGDIFLVTSGRIDKLKEETNSKANFNLN